MLTVSTSPGLAAKWLVPRLEKFRERHPDIDLRVDASMGLVDFAREDVHLALRYGRGRYPGLHTELLMRSEVFPVCAPGLLHGARGLGEPEDLQPHALIHDESLARDSSCPDWAMWLRAAGVTGIDPGRGVRFNQVALALDAAAAGRGVVLTRDIFAADDLVAGRLVRPFGAGMPVDFAVYLVLPPALVGLPKVKLFRDRVFEEGGPPRPGADRPVSADATAARGGKGRRNAAPVRERAGPRPAPHRSPAPCARSRT